MGICPIGVDGPIPYGPRLETMMTYLLYSQHLPVARTGPTTVGPISRGIHILPAWQEGAEESEQSVPLA